MSELVEAINRLTAVVEASGVLTFFVLLAILLFKGSSTNDELRNIQKELARLKEGEKRWID